MAEEYDVCVVGTGAGGGIMIDQLTAAGFQVVALERGAELSLAEFDDDELRNVIRDQVFSPDQLETYRPADGQPTETGAFSHIAYCLGGTMTHWSGWAWRFRPDEFKVLSTEGPVAGASLADWPVDYAEMEPFYERAEWDFGVAGDGGANPLAAPRKKGFPMPVHPARRATLRFADGARKLGYRPFPVPMAINSQPYGGRPTCMHGGACRNYGCPINAKATTYSVSIPRARASGRLDLRTQARVFELPVKNGRVTGARYFDRDGAVHEVRARQVVLSAGTFGTPQLLLNSTSGSFRHGLANGSGLVGANLQFHHHPAAVGVFDEDLRGYTGFETHTAIDELHPSDPKRGFIRGGVVAELNTFTHQPIAFSLVLAESMTKPGSRRWGADLKDRMRAFPRTMTVAAICEELPMESNRVDLDPKVKDRFGIPVVRITKTQHPNDLAMFRWYEKKIAEIVEAAGAREVHIGGLPGISLAEGKPQKGNDHNHGTCRMGSDPSKSVVDRWCRSHEVTNLWVVDSSVMPTNGGYNPTLTIMANAYRVADHFIREAKGNAL